VGELELVDLVEREPLVGVVVLLRQAAGDG